MSVAALGADTRPTFVSLGASLSSAPPIVNTKAVSITGIVTSASVPPQGSAFGSIGQTPSVTVSVPAAPTVVVKQPEPVRPYTGATSCKAYKEYFERICIPYHTIPYSFNNVADIRNLQQYCSIEHYQSSRTKVYDSYIVKET